MTDAFGSGTIGVGFGNFASGQPLSSRAISVRGISRFMMPPDAGVRCVEVMIGACLFLRQWGAVKSRSRPTSPAQATRCLGLNFSDPKRTSLSDKPGIWEHRSNGRRSPGCGEWENKSGRSSSAP